MISRKTVLAIPLALVMTMCLAGFAAAEKDGDLPVSTKTFKYVLPGGCCSGTYWVHEVKPEGIVGEIDWTEYNEFLNKAYAEQNAAAKDGSIIIHEPPITGMTTYCYKGLKEGTVELLFSELISESKKPSGHTAKVTLAVDKDLNITLVSEER